MKLRATLETDGGLAFDTDQTVQADSMMQYLRWFQMKIGSPCPRWQGCSFSASAASR
jgi:hypothetical protein